jgi:hypothetical protein
MTEPPAHIDPLSLPDDAFLTKARHMCSTKAAYATRAEAVTFTKRRHYALSAYLCPWCHHWHLTSYNRARAKAFKRRLSRLLRDDHIPADACTP